MFVCYSIILSIVYMCVSVYLFACLWLLCMQILKMADFGMARKFGIPFGHKKFTKEVVTLWYRPPEILLGKSVYDDKCDVWAVGECEKIFFQVDVSLPP